MGVAKLEHAESRRIADRMFLLSRPEAKAASVRVRCGEGSAAVQKMMDALDFPLAADDERRSFVQGSGFLAEDALGSVCGGPAGLLGPKRYRIRLVRWRIIYRIDDDDQTVLILRVRRKTGPETYEDID